MWSVGALTGGHCGVLAGGRVITTSGQETVPPRCVDDEHLFGYLY